MKREKQMAMMAIFDLLSIPSLRVYRFVGSDIYVTLIFFVPVRDDMFLSGAFVLPDRKSRQITLNMVLLFTPTPT